MGKWHCFLPVVLSMLFLSCCHVPISVSNTNVQIKNLLDLVELDPRVVSRWSAIEPLVQQHGITSPPSRSDWLNLIFESNKRTYKSRAILTAGARNWDSKYTRDLFERSDIAKLDAFARLQLVGLMAKKMLDDRVTAEFVLQETLNLWDARFPEKINLHGETPASLMAYQILPQVWQIPGHVRYDENDYGHLIKLWCRHALDNKDNWVFDKSIKKWKSESTTPLP